MLIFPDAPDIWRDCNRCSNLKRCEDAFPTSGICPHPDHVLLPYLHLCRSAELHSFYGSAIAQDAELAAIFARWQVKLPTEDKDFVAIRNYHLLHPHDNVATALVCDFLAFPLERLREKCREYYKRAPQEIDSAFTEAIFCSLTALTPADVAACSAHGGHWTLAFMDAMKFTMRMQLKERYLDLDDQNDAAFRAIFEREWHVLFKNYLDHRYNFLVIPRLSYQHMARYQELAKGDTNIRRTVSTYLIHQCFFYPHISNGWMPNLAHDALWPLIRRAYAPLIGATVARAARNLQLSKDELGIAAKAALRIEIEKIFDKFASEFDFFLNAPANFMRRGILGLNENKEAQNEIDKILELFGFLERSTDINTTPFAHYIKAKLDYWIQDKCPQVQDFNTTNTNVVTGADGQDYLTIKGVEQRFGISADRLRYLDKIGALKPIRAKNVSPTLPLLKPSIRLYLDNPQLRKNVDVASIRANSNSSGLTGKEINRKQAAYFLKVTVGILREIEAKYPLTVTKKGRMVVYDEKTLAQAQTIIEQKGYAQKAPKKRRL